MEELDERPTCFVIMPITTPADRQKDYGDRADHFQDVLETFFVPAIETAGMRAVKPTFDGSPVIQASIIRNLIEADLVLCDYSILNANVFFELGIRTALNKPVAMVRDQLTKIPFDVGPISTHTYDGHMYGPTFEAGKKKLAAHLVAVASGEDRNELWHHFGVTQFAEAPPAGSPMENVEAMLAELLAEARRSSNAGSASTINPGERDPIMFPGDDRELASERIAKLAGVAEILADGPSSLRVFLDMGRPARARNKTRQHIDSIARQHPSIDISLSYDPELD